MPLPKPRDELPQQMNLADADAMEPDAGRRTAAKECAAGELGPNVAAILASGERCVEEPGGGNNQHRKTSQIEERKHRDSFPLVISSQKSRRSALLSRPLGSGEQTYGSLPPPYRNGSRLRGGGGVRRSAAELTA